MLYGGTNQFLPHTAAILKIISALINRRKLENYKAGTITKELSSALYPKWVVTIYVGRQRTS